MEEFKVLDADGVAAMARRVVRTMAPPASLRADLVQTAIVAGLTALRSTERKGVRASRRIVRLRMQQAAYRVWLAEQRHAQGRVPELYDEHAVSPIAEPVNIAIAHEELALLWPRLGEQERQLITAHFFNHKTLRQIAAAVGESKSTTHKRLHAALAKARGADLASDHTNDD